MPDGAQPQPQPDPNDPRYKQAYDRTFQEGSKDNTGGGFFGGVIETVQDMMMAAEAGAFAVSPDVGQEVVKQLTKIQDSARMMSMGGANAAMRQRLGGGYASDIASFNTQVTDEGPGKLLKDFTDQIEQLKTAVNKSIAHYSGSDTGNRQRIDRSGGSL